MSIAIVMSQWPVVRHDDIDFETQGLQRLVLAIPYHWEEINGSIEWPLVVARNGEGPSVLVCGGTHGDEYEGQIAAFRLIDRFRIEHVRGLLMIAPMVNRPAALTHQRTSPIDGADLNRVFPGDRTQSGPSHAIARFVTEELIARADVVIDLHSGGTSEFVLSSNVMGRLGTGEVARAIPQLRAFDAPYALIFDETETGRMPHRGTLEDTARRAGKMALSSELGGGGRATARSLAAADRGLRNVLSSLGSVPDPVAGSSGKTQFLSLDRAAQYVTAPFAAHVGPLVELGAAVARGAPLIELIRAEASGFPRQMLSAPEAGVVAALASRGRVDEGELLAIVAQPVDV